MSEIFGSAFDLLRKNAIIVVPSLAVALAGAAISYTLAASGDSSWQFFGDLDAQGPHGFWLFFETIVAFGVRILGALIVIAFTTGMAGAAWTHGTASISDGVSAFRRSGLRATGALLLLFLIGLAAAVLAVPTFGISVLLYATFVLYTMPSVIVGGRSPVDGIVESIRIAARNFAVTFCAVVLIVILSVLGGLAGGFAGPVSGVGEAVQWVVMEAVVAYATLLVVGEYLKLAPVDQAP